MNLYLLIFSIFLLGAVLFLVVYLTQLPVYRLNAFGNFLKKVLGVLPITNIAEAILATSKISKNKANGKKYENELEKKSKKLTNLILQETSNSFKTSRSAVRISFDRPLYYLGY